MEARQAFEAFRLLQFESVLLECWKWRPHVVRIMELGAVKNFVFRFFR
jgi:hypothetical protein